MTYSMVSITKKTVRGNTYYYARECRRVDGKPKIVWQKYLGKAEDIVAGVSRSRQFYEAGTFREGPNRLRNGHGCDRATQRRSAFRADRPQPGGRSDRYFAARTASCQATDRGAG